ncbi:MAG TPA: polysulfide reductase NrfD, partial [Candidatus Sumerlaeota bacterium]|nr:polysulfide reductase NrfD [Candidatus Sumerlaeota bacterium]
MSAAAGQPPEPDGLALLGPGVTAASVTDHVAGIVIARPSPRFWWLAFGLGFLLMMLLLASIAWILVRGVGVWGVNVPVAWGFAIVNFVWWIGIGHAGTLISAILLLMKQTWRNSINRFAEAMTLFAVACAGMFPLLHLGRPQVFYWLFPYPDTMNLWPQWRSPLVWDVFAVTTYGIVSLVFWYVGLVPDLATIRDRADQPWKQRLFGIFALGWRNSALHWRRHQSLYLLLAALATPLV